MRNRKIPWAVYPSVDPWSSRKTKGLVATTLLTLVIVGAAGRNRTHDPLVRSFCHTAKLLIYQGLKPSVPTHFALFWTVPPSKVTQKSPSEVASESQLSVGFSRSASIEPVRRVLTLPALRRMESSGLHATADCSDNCKRWTAMLADYCLVRYQTRTSPVRRVAALRQRTFTGAGRPETVKRGRAADPALGWREAQAQHSQLAQPPVDDVSGDMKSGQF